jgi:hypothetical protein
MVSVVVIDFNAEVVVIVVDVRPAVNGRHDSLVIEIRFESFVDLRDFLT